MENIKKIETKFQMGAVMLAFFAMGAVDLIGISSNYVKKDFDLSDTMANLLSFMVFAWFLIFSVPTGLMMNKIGRKKTVLLSLVVTAIALIIPVISYNYGSTLVSFSLLGIGNTLMQVSLNPLLSNVVTKDKYASNMALGQLIKTIASFFGPVIAGWCALQFGNWRLTLLIYALFTILSFILLSTTKIKETLSNKKNSTIIDCFRLLEKVPILLLFIGILAHVGIDAGINITAPKILMERIPGQTLTNAGFATSLYFLFRIIGSLSGTYILRHFSMHKFFIISVICIAVSVTGLFFANGLIPLYICIALIGYGNSNIFSIVFVKAMQMIPGRDNEISGLMIMGIVGGAIFPLLMGVCSDLLKSQTGAVLIIAILTIYLFFLSPFIKVKR